MTQKGSSLGNTKLGVLMQKFITFKKYKCHMAHTHLLISLQQTHIAKRLGAKSQTQQKTVTKKSVN